MWKQKRENRAQMISYIEANQDNFYRFTYLQLQEKDDTIQVIRRTILHALSDNFKLIRPEEYECYFQMLLKQECKAVKSRKEERK